MHSVVMNVIWWENAILAILYIYIAVLYIKWGNDSKGTVLERDQISYNEHF